jgi:sugar phosphate isomerase/epimerase
VAFGAQGILLSRRLDLAAEDESKRDEAVQAVCEGIDEALALGASACGILAGKDPGDRFKRELAKGRLVESIERLCRYAADKGSIVIELEQFDRAPFGKNSLIGPTEEAVEIAQEVRGHHKNFGLLLDLSHLPLLNENPRLAVNRAGEFLTHAHIGNCVKRDPTHPAYGDRHPVFGIPEGENDVPEIREFLAGLMDVAFLEREGERILSFEVKPFGSQTTEEVVQVCKEKLDRAWELL